MSEHVTNAGCGYCEIANTYHVEMDLCRISVCGLLRTAGALQGAWGCTRASTYMRNDLVSTWAVVLKDVVLDGTGGFDELLG